MRIPIFIIVLLTILPAFLSAQEDNPVLFTINGDTVRVSEFKYIYTKNNAQNADYSRTSLEEYLDLYIRFKLKVKAAREAGYDTIRSLQKELQGYRQQLANSYLQDKAVKKQLVEEVYERQKKDIGVSHVLIRLDRRATPEDSARAYEKAMLARLEILEGKDFADVAKKYSDDKGSAAKGGQIGYVTAMLPRGYYQVENAIYNMEKGDISMPVLSPRGYHILRVDDVRPARGEVEISHILIRKGNGEEERQRAQKRIEEVYQMLEDGQSFEELARRYSEDNNTAPRGGYIGYIGIGTYEEAFEDAAFALEKDGTWSEPVESALGFHIIKKVGEKERLPLNQMQRRIEAELSQTERIDRAREALIKEIKASSDFRLNRDQLLVFTGKLDSSFFNFAWKAPASIGDQVLFSLGGLEYTEEDFASFIERNKRMRLQMAGRIGLKKAVRQLFDIFTEDAVLKYEEQRLEEKYPDFKALMREYEEGILLFEITKDMVWDRAAEDSTGLNKYYEKHRDDYQWDPRLLLAHFTLNSLDQSTAEKIYRYAGRKSAEKTLKKFKRKDIDIEIDYERIEKESKKAEIFPWEEGWMTDLDFNEEMQAASFTKVEEILKPQPKSLAEARGYIIADYQDYLEKKWVEDLRQKYDIKLNKQVFESLIRD